MRGRDGDRLERLGDHDRLELVDVVDGDTDELGEADGLLVWIVAPLCLELGDHNAEVAIVAALVPELGVLVTLEGCGLPVCLKESGGHVTDGLQPPAEGTGAIGTSLAVDEYVASGLQFLEDCGESVLPACLDLSLGREDILIGGDVVAVGFREQVAAGFVAGLAAVAEIELDGDSEKITKELVVGRLGHDVVGVLRAIDTAEAHGSSGPGGTHVAEIEGIDCVLRS